MMSNENPTEKRYVRIPRSTAQVVFVMALIAFAGFLLNTVDDYRSNGIESYARFAVKLLSICGLVYTLFTFLIALYFRKEK